MRRLFFLFLTLAVLSASAARHRELFFTSARVAEAKRNIAADTAYAAAWRTLCHKADVLVARPKTDQCDAAALAWLITGDTRYADATRTALLAAASDTSWGNAEMMSRRPAWRSELTMAHRALVCANAYNAIRERLSAADRRTISRALWRLAAEPLLGDWILPDTRIHALNTMGHNWWASCVGMGGVLALALADDVPEALGATEALDKAFAEWYAFPGDRLQHKVATFDPLGGMYEGINYGGYALQQALLYRLAERNACPARRQTDIPQLAHIADFFCHTCYPRTGELFTTNFGDSHLRTTGYNALLLLTALGGGTPQSAWYISRVRQHQHREQYSLDTPLGLLYTPSARGTKAPPLQLAAIFPTMGWATMRTSFNPDATMVAIKCGATWNHAHADAASILVYHGGEQIIGEAGRCWYAAPEYRGYYFQSQAHNVILADGRGQPHAQQYYGAGHRGTLSDLVTALGMAYVLADATGPNADRFARYFRHLLLLDDVLVVVDEVATHQPATLSWLWHPGGETKRKGATLVVEKGKAQATITPLFPEPLAPSAFQQDYPRTLVAETQEAKGEDLKDAPPYYALTMPYKTERATGVTVITLSTPHAASAATAVERIEGRNWIGVSLRHGAHTTHLYIDELADGRLMHSNSWIEADGWQTDARMLVVCDGRPTLIVYGSALRRDGRTIFSSLTKQTKALIDLKIKD